MLMIMRVESGWQVINLADLRQKIEEGQIDSRQLITMKTLKVPPPPCYPINRHPQAEIGRNRQKSAECGRIRTDTSARLTDSRHLAFTP